MQQPDNSIFRQNRGLFEFDKAKKPSFSLQERKKSDQPVDFGNIMCLTGRFLVFISVEKPDTSE